MPGHHWRLRVSTLYSAAKGKGQNGRRSLLEQKSRPAEDWKNVLTDEPGLLLHYKEDKVSHNLYYKSLQLHSSWNIPFFTARTQDQHPLGGRLSSYKKRLI